MKPFSKPLSLVISIAVFLLIVSNLPEDVRVYAQQDNEQNSYLETTNNQEDNQNLYVETINHQENEVQPNFLPALPIALIVLKEALIALGALIGATALATFVNYAIKHGMTEACKKYSKNNKHIKRFCQNNGFPTK